MKQSDFNLYKSTAYNSVFKSVPIQLLEEFKKAFNNHTFRVRYRGPRMATRSLDGRSIRQAHQDCIKMRAEYFSVYDLQEKPNEIKNLQRLNDNQAEIIEKLSNEIKNLSLQLHRADNELVLMSEIVEEKDSEINDLDEQLGRASYVNEELQNQINHLERALNKIAVIINETDC